MRTHVLGLLAIVSLVALCGSAVAPTQAANINMTAANCQPTDRSQQEVWHLASGTSNNQVAFTGSTRLDLACDVPRSPLAVGATSGGFYVDGDNIGGTRTDCIVYATSYTGAPLGGAGFSSTATSYDQFLSLPVSMLGTFSYTSMACTISNITGAGKYGRLRGVTSLQ